MLYLYACVFINSGLCGAGYRIAEVQSHLMRESCWKWACVDRWWCRGKSMETTIPGVLGRPILGSTFVLYNVQHDALLGPQAES